MPDPTTGRWVQGLIHLHSRYSDGTHGIGDIKRFAKERQYAYMVMTDHAERPSLIGNLQAYVAECESLRDADADGTTFLVIPGIEIAAGWTLPNDQDASTAHTLGLDITDHLDLMTADAPNSPIGQWQQAGCPPNSPELVLATLQANGILAMPAHPFQYAELRFAADLLAGSDYRYKMPLLSGCPHVDMHYRTVTEITHEAEDLALYAGLLSRWVSDREQPMPFVFTSSDFHGFLSETAENLLGAGITNWIGAEMPGLAGIAIEQFSHSTWTYLEGELSRENVVAAIASGRTCAARGTDNIITRIVVSPVPGGDTPTQMATPSVSLEVDFAHDTSRPMFVALYRDGIEVSQFADTFARGRRSIAAQLSDHDAPVGVHAYVVMVAGKLVSSPILIEKV